MTKITTNDPETLSVDVVAENVNHLKVLFPEAFTEGKVDFEVLKQLLGGEVDERDEKVRPQLARQAPSPADRADTFNRHPAPVPGRQRGLGHDPKPDDRGR